MKEKGTESLKKTTLSQEVLQAAGCSEETIRKILQEKNGRCQCRCLRQYRKEILKKLYREQEKLTNVDYLLYHLEKKQQEKS
ncbi:hypothetical protein [Acidaminococcus fermentans]|uniref:hypothetical protein n=1 Tax=Acidaminococcus fermentans TaxID=905 RepID=UPI00265E446B|nr:hypothetical protein [Acidaminococcus fermentans]